MFWGFPTGDFHVTRGLREDTGGTPYDGLYREAPPERVTFFGASGHERVRISLIKVYKMVGKSVIWSVKGPKRANR